MFLLVLWARGLVLERAAPDKRNAIRHNLYYQVNLLSTLVLVLKTKFFCLLVGWFLKKKDSSI